MDTGFAAVRLARICFSLMMFSGVATVATAESAEPAATPPASSSPVTAAPLAQTTVGARFDCAHDFNAASGSTQQCLAVSGLRLTHRQQLTNGPRGMLRLDPFATPATDRADSPLRQALPVQSGAMSMLDAYAITWTARPSLEIGVESYSGATRLPTQSGLALPDSLTDSGWKQTAATVMYNLGVLSGTRVKFVAGNGEGELLRNVDPQQYFALELGAGIVPGVRLELGGSFDGNSFGSERSLWTSSVLQERCGIARSAAGSNRGHSTQRLSAAVVLDGSLAAARGLKAGLGFQRSVSNDLDAGAATSPTAADLDGCPRLDPTDVFVETAPGDSKNAVRRSTIAFNASWRILDRWFVGFDYRQRQTDFGSEKIVQSCSRFDDTGCVPEGDPKSGLSQAATTFGAGLDLTEGLVWSFGWSRIAFDKKYAKFNYAGDGERAVQNLELFNSRLAWNWD